MICSKCGCEQGSAAQFCRECGSLLAAPAAMAGAVYQGTMPPPRPRVHQNLQPLGIMWAVFGVCRLLAVLATAGLASCAFLTSVFSVFVAYGLLKRQPWARTLAIVGAILALVTFPFGTALGIYTLWVLAPRQSAAEWNVIAVTNPVTAL